MGYKLLIINPGSTSTKLAIYEDEKRVFQENYEHSQEEIKRFERIPDQIPFRMEVIQRFLKQAQVHPTEFSAVVGRGGLVFGLQTGGYLVNEDLFYALEHDHLSSPHASNLGGCWENYLWIRWGFRLISMMRLPPASCSRLPR